MVTRFLPPGGPKEQLQFVLERVRAFLTPPTEGWGVWSPVLAEWFNPGSDRPYHYARADAEQFLRRAHMSYPTGDWRLMRVPLDESGEQAGPPEEVTQSEPADAA